MEYFIESEKQRKINNNIIIYGVQQTPDENVKLIVEAIATHLGVEMKHDDICSAYRKPISKSATNSSGLPAPIVATISNKTTKEAIFAAKKGIKLNTNIFTDHIQDSGRPIYINEQLTRHNQFIFKMARDIKREHRVENACAKNCCQNKTYRTLR